MVDHPSPESRPKIASRTSIRARLGLAFVSTLVIAVAMLRMEGQRWWCRCGRFFLWSGQIQSAHNSQHLADPYSFTHLLHGLIFYAFLRPWTSRLGFGSRFAIALVLEACWEVAENSDAVIERYRRATFALGYAGDSVVNSLGDIACCAIGFLLAGRLPVRWSIALFIVVEVLLLVVYRDCLVLNTLMLVFPIEAVKSWQLRR